MANEDELISQFCEITGSNASRAGEYLTQSNYNVELAVAAFYADSEEGDATGAGSSQATPAAEPEAAYTGPRTLDGRPAPQSAFTSSNSSSKKPVKKTGLATLSSLGGGHDHDDDDDDDDDDEDENRGPRDLFAGGEKSGLAVQDPAGNPSHAKKVISDILAQAKANSEKRPEPGSESAAAGPSRSNRFQGSGQTLGGEGVESRTIPNPLGQPIPVASSEPTGPVQERILHLWSDGFSIDDGPLRRFGDEANRQDLQMIRSGRAPLHLMNVDHDQPVDVKLQKHEEPWRQLPRIYRPFGGQGNRLGSPVPGDGNVTISQATAPAPAAAAAASSSASQTPNTNVDNSQPTVMIRFQLPDGSRLPARFNLTSTIGDLYQFVRSASAETRTTPFLIQSTFPSKEYTDHGQKLQDIDAFKKGGIAVVKWA